MLTIGLAGNPNCGKTTLFNLLTGSSAHVGNWPGVTVDRREGKLRLRFDMEAEVIDLPGIYSLSPYTPEERVARGYLFGAEPDLIINIVDASNLERNLYLTTQLLETDCPMILAFNMMDVVEQRGEAIDMKGLSRLLQREIIPISASKGQGIQALLKAVTETLGKPCKGRFLAERSPIQEEIADIQGVLKKHKYSHSVFQAVKYLEGDKLEASQEGDNLQNLTEDEKIILSAAKQSVREKDRYDDMEAFIADLRYQFITRECVPMIQRQEASQGKKDIQGPDKLLTHPLFGIPIFFVFLFMMFHVTFSSSFFGISGLPSPGIFLRNCVEGGILWFRHGMLLFFQGIGASDWIIGFLLDGVLSGVGSVLSFTPQLLFLFLFLSLMEDSGYMARAAFLMDRPLKSLGMSGKAFLPLLMGLGCSVPGIMAARTLENKRDRQMTMLLVPYMSCGAKLSIYALFAAALFQKNPDRIIFSIYLIGIFTAIAVAFCIKGFFPDKETVFIMELPPYRKPKAKSILLLLWDKLKGYLLKAGTVILLSSVIVWILSGYMIQMPGFGEKSVLQMLGETLAPIFKPLGFGGGPDGWKSVAAIFTGLAAKEAVVSTLGVLYSPVSGEEALLSALPGVFHQASALSFMVFNLLFIPCAAAVATFKTESGSIRFTIFALCFWSVVAWIISFLIYQGALAAGL